MNTTNWCPHCQELWMYNSVLRYSTNGRGDEQPVKPKYCALCGNELKVFPGWSDETVKRRYY